MATDTATTQRRFTVAVTACGAALLLMWSWSTLVFMNAHHDECRARMSGTSELSSALTMGVAPLVVVSVGALIALIATTPGAPARRVLVGSATFLAVTAGCIIFEWGFSGLQLFTYLNLGANCSP